MIVLIKEKKMLFYGALLIALATAYFFGNIENSSIYLFDAFYASYNIVNNISFALFFVTLLIVTHEINKEEDCETVGYTSKFIGWMIGLLILMTFLFVAVINGVFLEVFLNNAILMIEESGEKTLGFFNIVDIDRSIYTSGVDGDGASVKGSFVASGMASIILLASSVFCVVRIITVISKK